MKEPFAFMSTAATMLNLNIEDLHPKLVQDLTYAHTRCLRAGGKLISRQTIACIISIHEQKHEVTKD